MNRMTRRVAILACSVMFFAAGTASAQLSTWTDRGFLNLSGAGQTGSTTSLTTTFKSFSIYNETANGSAAQTLETGGGIFDITVGARVWNNLGVGFDFFKAPSKTMNAPVAATVPDLAFYDTPRAVSTAVNNLEYAETWVAFPIVFMIPVTDKIDVMPFAGPALVSVHLDVVDPNTFSLASEGTSGPQLNLASTTLSKKTWGYQLGVDARYMFNRTVGAGAFLRVTKATSNLTGAVSVDAGGFQVGGGLRVRF